MNVSNQSNVWALQVRRLAAYIGNESPLREDFRQMGFERIKNNDYYNAAIGVYLEDLHYENIIVCEEGDCINLEDTMSMEFLKYLKSIFSKKTKSPPFDCVDTIRKMGYREAWVGAFVKETSYGRNVIWITNSGLKIKVYASRYGESDFLPAPLDDEKKVVQFIKSNEIS